MTSVRILTGVWPGQEGKKVVDGVELTRVAVPSTGEVYYRDANGFRTEDR